MSKNNHRSNKSAQWRASVLAVASCFALAVAPTAADAAGLGKVSVFSALGQPLRAEIEVTATREELAGMKAQLASRDAFRQAGIDFPATLHGIGFALDTRPNGQSVIRLTSAAPISDPFVDMLIELNWSTGRLVREYTFLLDPPEIVAKNTPAEAPVIRKAQVQEVKPVSATPVAPASASTPASAATQVLQQAPSSIDEETRVRAREARERGELDAMPATPVASGETHEVKRGDTLSKIANAVKPEGVVLDQMLVGLLRANQEAFDSGNMNRLRTGKILTIPDKAAVEAVPPVEAKKVVTAQASDWNAYRRKLAAMAAKASPSDSAGSQATTGKITAKVEDKLAPEVAPKDQVKVSKSEGSVAAGAVPAGRSAEEAIVKEKSLKEAAERAAALEKNVANLQKLIELKDQNLAGLQKQSSAPDDSKKEEAPLPVKPAAPAESAAAPSPAPAEAAPAAPAAPEAAVPKEKTSLVDTLLAEPLLPAAGAGILALLAGFFLIRRRRGEKDEAVPAEVPETPAAATTALPVEAPTPVAEETAPVEESAPPPAIETTEIPETAEMPPPVEAVVEELPEPAVAPEPVPEEEIPARVTIETLDFDLGPEEAPSTVSRLIMESPAEEAQTVVESALESDIESASESVSEPIPEPEKPVAQEDIPGALDFTLPDLDLAAETPTSAPTPASEPLDLATLDFDLNFANESPATAETAASDTPAVLAESDLAPSTEADAFPAIDLPAAATVARVAPLAPVDAENDEEIDAPAAAEDLRSAAAFDMKSITLDLEAAVSAADAAAEADDDEVAPSSAPSGDAVSAESADFDRKAETPSAVAALAAEPEPLASAPLERAPASPAPEEDAFPADFDVNPNEEAATKLDLAKAYEEMGDLEGARELLNEVLEEGDAGQREKARAILSKIGA